MKTWKTVNRELFNSRCVGWPVLRREFVEIFEEIFRCKFKAAWVEVTQCSFFAQLMLHQLTGFDWRPCGVNAVLKEFYDRIDVWRGIFQREGLDFNVDYLVGGSNYSKPEKVAAAFALARAQQKAD